MSPTFFHVHHAESRILLPEVLEPGTAYFVDDEKCIIVDYGDGKGPRTYGGVSWITSSGAGDNGFLQDQIDTLAGGVLAFEKAYWDETQYIRTELAHKAEVTGEELRELRRLSGVNAEGLLNLTRAVSEEIEKARGQSAGIILQADANTEGILRLSGIIDEQAARTQDALTGLSALSNANTEGILRLTEAINEQADKQRVQNAHFTLQEDANTEGIMRLAFAVNDHADKTNTRLSGLEHQAEANTADIEALASALTEHADVTGEETYYLPQQVNANTEGILRLVSFINEQSETTGDQIARLTRQTNANTEAVLHLARAVNELANRTKASVSLLNRTVTYMLSTLSIPLPETPQDKDPLDNETLETEDGKWVIQQTFNADGTVTFELQAVALAAETLTAGDTISCDGQEWTVESIELTDGTLSLSLRQ